MFLFDLEFARSSCIDSLVQPRGLASRELWCGSSSPLGVIDWGHRYPSLLHCKWILTTFLGEILGFIWFYIVLFVRFVESIWGSGEEVWKSSLDFVILAKGQLSVTSVQKFFDIILGPSTGFFLPELYHETLQELWVGCDDFLSLDFFQFDHFQGMNSTLIHGVGSAGKPSRRAAMPWRHDRRRAVLGEGAMAQWGPQGTLVGRSRWMAVGWRIFLG